MSGLTTPVFFGLIAGQIVTLGITKKVLEKLAGEGAAFTGLVAAFIAAVFIVTLGMASMDSLSARFPDLDTEAWVMALPIAGFIGSVLYWICDGVLRVVKGQKNA